MTRKLLAAVLLLAACAPARDPAPALPEGAATVSSLHEAQSFLRGVRGDYSTSPKGRPHTLLTVQYALTCLADGAEARRRSTIDTLEEAFKEAPLYFDNPRERGWWWTDASERAFKNGCIVTGLEYVDRNTNGREALLWALRNGVAITER